MLYETQYTEIHSSDECGVEGYVIVMPKRAVTNMADLTSAELQDLSEQLAQVQGRIHEQYQPERIYCLSFGELNPRLHFHVFPRTAELREHYWKAFPEQANQPVVGPLLFAWAQEAIPV